MAKKTKTVTRNTKGRFASKAEVVSDKIQTLAADHVQRRYFNDLNSAIFGAGAPTYYGTQLSQVNTLFKNERWYLLSNMRQLLNEVYVEQGIVRNFIDVPVDDALRGGINILSKQLSPEEVKKLQTAVARKGILTKTIAQATKWNRLFGGAGILIITGQDPKTPLDLSRVKKGEKIEYRPCDMWEFYYDKQLEEGYEPILEDALEDASDPFYSYYGTKVHKSRVMKLTGLTAPSFIRPRLRGWGFSILESVVRPLNIYLKTANLVFEVLDEFKIDVFKIKNLTNSLLSSDGEAALHRRLQTANRNKNFLHSLVMDGEDDYIQKQLSFAGLADVAKENRIQLASELRMPLSKLFGIGAQGFNSGEDDIENYNTMIESDVRAKVKFDILTILELECMVQFGYVPEDLEIEFEPLRMLSSEQQENVKTQKFNRALMARQAAEITSEEFRDMCNKDNLLPITLEKTGLLELEQEEDEADQAGDAAESDDADADGPGGKTNPGDDEPPAATITVHAPKSKLNPKAAKNSLDYGLLTEDFKGPKIVTVGVRTADRILTGRRRDNGLWTNPGGHVDPGEELEDAAIREVFEEAGIKIEKSRLKLIAAEKHVSHRNGKEFVVFAYEAVLPEMKATAKNDPDREIMQWKWVDILPNTPELLPDARHAKSDAVLNYLFGDIK